ncbi:MAG: DUF1499 domain-containing protein [Zavarzinella sp.]
MSVLRWFTHNVADTAAGTHADLQPVVVHVPPAELVTTIVAQVGAMPRWHVESSTEQQIHLTRRTRLFRFIDDIFLTISHHESGALVHFRSKSRLGKGDLGQNRRNILQLIAHLKPILLEK